MSRQLAKTLNIEHDVDDVQDNEPEEFDAFGQREIALIEETINELVPSANTPAKIQMAEDFELSRDVLREILTVSKITFKQASGVAQSSGEPQAVDAVSKLMKSMSEVASSLIDTHAKKKDFNELKFNPDEKQGGDINVDKAVFIGSTAALLERMKHDPSSETD